MNKWDYNKLWTTKKKKWEIEWKYDITINTENERKVNKCMVLYGDEWHVGIKNRLNAQQQFVIYKIQNTIIENKS